MPHTGELLRFLKVESVMTKVCIVTRQATADNIRTSLQDHNLADFIDDILTQEDIQYVDEEGKNRTKTKTKGEVIKEFVDSVLPNNQELGGIVMIDDVQQHLLDTESAFNGTNIKVLTIDASLIREQCE